MMTIGESIIIGALLFAVGVVLCGILDSIETHRATRTLTNDKRTTWQRICAKWPRNYNVRVYGPLQIHRAYGIIHIHVGDVPNYFCIGLQWGWPPVLFTLVDAR